MQLINYDADEVVHVPLVQDLRASTDLKHREVILPVDLISWRVKPPTFL